MKMPWKDPNNWINVLGPEIKAGIVSAFIATLRIMYDGKESKWTRICLESVLCGALAYGFASGLEYFNLGPGMAVFCGATIGFFGVEFVRSRAHKYVDKKVGNDD